MPLKAQLLLQLRFFFCFAGIFLFSGWPVHATTCPSNAHLHVEHYHKEKIHMRDLALNAGTRAVTVNLNWPGALSKPFSLDADGLQTRHIIELFPNRPLWRLTIHEKDTPAEVIAVTATYVLTADNHKVSRLSVPGDMDSDIPVTLTALPVSHKNLNRQSVFEGSVQIEVDLATAATAGTYGGTLQISLECEYAY